MPELAQEEKPFVALASSLERAGRVEELIRLYESRSIEVEAPAEAAALLARAAELAGSKRKTPGRAEDLLRQAQALAPDAPAALRALLGLFEQTQDPAALAETLEALAARASGGEAATLFGRAAELFEHK